MHNDSGKGKISLLLQIGIPSTTTSPSPKRPNVEDQVRACIQRIDDGTGSEVDFLVLRRLKADLLKIKNKNDRVKNLLEMIEPTIRRFGYYF